MPPKRWWRKDRGAKATGFAVRHASQLRFRVLEVPTFNNGRWVLFFLEYLMEGVQP